MQIYSLDCKLRKAYENGDITLREASENLYLYGCCDHYPSEEETRKILYK